jgi:hypothetical protein
LVTDKWTSIKQYRTSGAWIYLEAWENEIVVLADSYTWSPVVTVNFYDTYIY